jgi:hypothetical protein
MTGIASSFGARAGRIISALISADILSGFGGTLRAAYK